MVIVFGAGHVLGPKSYMGYTEDPAMLDLAQKKAVYARKYGIETHVMNVTEIASYQGIEDFIRGVQGELCSLEHSDADDSVYEEPNEPNRVTVFRTVLNPGDGCCRLIGQACADVLGIADVFVEHKANSSGNDAYGAIGRAMKAGCKDAWLFEHGFHTHAATRAKLSDPGIRQQLAEREVDAMAIYYGWSDGMLIKGNKGLAVTYWQKSLLKWDSNCLPKWGADSDFGLETETATKNFQAFVGLNATGIVDTNTFAYMLNLLANTVNNDPAIIAELDASKLKISSLTNDVANVSNLLIVEQNLKEQYIQSDANKKADLQIAAKAFADLQLIKEKYLIL